MTGEVAEPEGELQRLIDESAAEALGLFESLRGHLPASAAVGLMGQLGELATTMHPDDETAAGVLGVFDTVRPHVPDTLAAALMGKLATLASKLTHVQRLGGAMEGETVRSEEPRPIAAGEPSVPAAATETAPPLRHRQQETRVRVAAPARPVPVPEPAPAPAPPDEPAPPVTLEEPSPLPAAEEAAPPPVVQPEEVAPPPPAAEEPAAPVAPEPETPPPPAAEERKEPAEPVEQRPDLPSRKIKDLDPERLAARNAAAEAKHEQLVRVTIEDDQGMHVQGEPVPFKIYANGAPNTPLQFINSILEAWEEGDTSGITLPRFWQRIGRDGMGPSHAIKKKALEGIRLRFLEEVDKDGMVGYRVADNVIIDDHRLNPPAEAPPAFVQPQQRKVAARPVMAPPPARSSAPRPSDEPAPSAAATRAARSRTARRPSADEELGAVFAQLVDGVGLPGAEPPAPEGPEVQEALLAEAATVPEEAEAPPEPEPKSDPGPPAAEVIETLHEPEEQAAAEESPAPLPPLPPGMVMTRVDGAWMIVPVAPEPEPEEVPEPVAPGETIVVHVDPDGPEASPAEVAEATTGGSPAESADEGAEEEDPAELEPEHPDEADEAPGESEDTSEPEPEQAEDTTPAPVGKRFFQKEELGNDQRLRLVGSASEPVVYLGREPLVMDKEADGLLLFIMTRGGTVPVGKVTTFLQSTSAGVFEISKDRTFRKLRGLDQRLTAKQPYELLYIDEDEGTVTLEGYGEEKPQEAAASKSKKSGKAGSHKQYKGPHRMPTLEEEIARKSRRRR